MANSRNSPHTVPLLVLIVASLAGTVVALGAAVVSYAHMHELCIAAGDSELLAGITPLLVDGMVVFASALLYAQKRLGEEAHWLALIGVVLGVVASLGANIASTIPETATSDTVRLTVAAWPPLALGIVGHLAWQLLAIALRGGRQDVPEHPGMAVEIGQQVNIGTMTLASQDSRQEAHAALPVDHPEAIPTPSRELSPATPRPARRTAPRRAKGNVPDEEWVPFVRRLRDDLAVQGRSLNPNALKEASRKDGLAPHSLGHDRASRLVDLVEQEASPR
jgi:hypothetical protein